MNLHTLQKNSECVSICNELEYVVHASWTIECAKATIYQKMIIYNNKSDLIEYHFKTRNNIESGEVV